MLARSRQDALAALERCFSGDLLTAPSADYEQARRIWNAMIDRKPAIIARCRTVDDVVACVNIARKFDLLVSIKAGGHNVSGSSVCPDGLMIDLSLMNAVSVQAHDHRVRVQGGALWRHIDSATQEFGQVTPGGIISNTGVAGLTLGGGIGWTRGKFGLSIDNLLSVTIVTANGQIRRASATQNPELYWGVRGGGGNFGVVVEFEFRTHDLPSPLLYFCAAYDVDQAQAVIRCWRDFIQSAPEEISSILEFSNVSERAEAFDNTYWGKRVVWIYAVYSGDQGQAATAVEPLRKFPGFITETSDTKSYCEIQSQYDALLPAGEFQNYWKCLYLDGLDDETISQIITYATTIPSPYSECSLWDLRGAVSRVAAGATAFGDRQMAFLLSLDSAWREDAEAQPNISQTQAFWEQMRLHSQGRLYVNFAGLAENPHDLVRAAYGDNYERLVRLKNRYDPTNLFRMNLNIEPDHALGLGPG